MKKSKAIEEDLKEMNRNENMKQIEVREIMKGELITEEGYKRVE